MANQLLAELADGAELDGVLLCRRVERSTSRNGQPYLRLELADRSASVRAHVWEPRPEHEAFLRDGVAVRVRGVFVNHPTYGPQLKLSALDPAEPGSYDPSDLYRQPPPDPQLLEGELRELVATVEDPPLRALLERVFDPEGRLWTLFREAPAAKHVHQPYRHGLLEHTLEVAKGVAAVAPTLAGVDRDLALAGALLHDIGKVDAYALIEGSAELTDAGRLHGEIALGYFRLRRLIDDLAGFPRERALALLHIILSHHGALEHGSPVLPATREAVLVHTIDNLSAKIGSFERLADQLAPGATFSAFDRALGTSAYFSPRPS